MSLTDIQYRLIFYNEKINCFTLKKMVTSIVFVILQQLISRIISRPRV